MSEFKEGIRDLKIKNNLVIELHVPDLGTAQVFYSELQFRPIYEETVGVHLGYLAMLRDDSLGYTMLNFYGGDERVANHSFFNKFPLGTRRGYGVEITIPVGDVDGLFQHVITRMEDHIVQPLVLKKWGKRDFRIEDPFGFYLRFTEPMLWGNVIFNGN